MSSRKHTNNSLKQGRVCVEDMNRALSQVQRVQSLENLLRWVLEHQGAKYERDYDEMIGRHGALSSVVLKLGFVINAPQISSCGDYEVCLNLFLIAHFLVHCSNNCSNQFLENSSTELGSVLQSSMLKSDADKCLCRIHRQQCKVWRRNSLQLVIAVLSEKCPTLIMNKFVMFEGILSSQDCPISIVLNLFRVREISSENHKTQIVLLQMLSLEAVKLSNGFQGLRKTELNVNHDFLIHLLGQNTITHSRNIAMLILQKKYFICPKELMKLILEELQAHFHSPLRYHQRRNQTLNAITTSIKMNDNCDLSSSFLLSVACEHEDVVLHDGMFDQGLPSKMLHYSLRCMESESKNFLKFSYLIKALNSCIAGCSVTKLPDFISCDEAKNIVFTLSHLVRDVLELNEPSNNKEVQMLSVKTLKNAYNYLLTLARFDGSFVKHDSVYHSLIESFILAFSNQYDYDIFGDALVPAAQVLAISSENSDDYSRLLSALVEVIHMSTFKPTNLSIDNAIKEIGRTTNKIISSNIDSAVQRRRCLLVILVLLQTNDDNFKAEVLDVMLLFVESSERLEKISQRDLDRFVVVTKKLIVDYRVMKNDNEKRIIAIAISFLCKVMPCFSDGSVSSCMAEDIDFMRSVKQLASSPTEDNIRPLSNTNLSAATLFSSLIVNVSPANVCKILHNSTQIFEKASKRPNETSTRYKFKLPRHELIN